MWLPLAEAVTSSGSAISRQLTCGHAHDQAQAGKQALEQARLAVSKRLHTVSTQSAHEAVGMSNAALRWSWLQAWLSKGWQLSPACLRLSKEPYLFNLVYQLLPALCRLLALLAEQAIHCLHRHQCWLGRQSLRQVSLLPAGACRALLQVVHQRGAAPPQLAGGHVHVGRESVCRWVECTAGSAGLVARLARVHRKANRCCSYCCCPPLPG